MNRAIGIIETQHFVVAVHIFDQMMKNTRVKLIGFQDTWGGKLVVITVEGTIADVREAIEIGSEIGKSKYPKYFKNAVVITNPNIQIMELVNQVR